MTVNFKILSANTVPVNYRWDFGNPFESFTTTTTAYTTTDYVSGYAPGVKVYFENTSILNEGNDYTNFIWNFGDYYNSTNNVVSLSEYSGTEHLYLMPGKYTVTLTAKQTKLLPYIDPKSKICIGKYDIRWFWDDLLSDKLNNLTWDNTLCVSDTFPKTWNDEFTCLQKHCKIWSWHETKQDGATPITWEQSKNEYRFEKKWTYEANDTICSVPDANHLKTLDITESVIIKTGVVEVFETSPKAALQCLTTSITGTSPYTVTLSPKPSITGSFPIDQIDWDFGDGTPIKTVNRHTIPDTNIFIYSNSYFDDPKDPRNYDALYTYKRKLNDYSVFYPSITCYSSNTFKADSCSMTIGPILLPQLDGILNVTKIRNTDNGILYAYTIDKKLFFAVQNPLQPDAAIQINTPQNTLINNFTTPNYYFGNKGLGYPVTTNPSTFYVPPNVSFNYLTIEEIPQYPVLTQDNNLIKVG